MTTSLYDRLGGAPAIDAAVELFYQKVLADPSLRPFFRGVDLGDLKDHQRTFLTVAFGGPSGYSGRELSAAHGDLVERGLTDAHFDAVVGHLGATLAELGVGAPLIQEAAGIAESVRGAVLGRA